MIRWVHYMMYVKGDHWTNVIFNSIFFTKECEVRCAVFVCSYIILLAQNSKPLNSMATNLIYYIWKFTPFFTHIIIDRIKKIYMGFRKYLVRIMKLHISNKSFYCTNTELRSFKLFKNSVCIKKSRSKKILNNKTSVSILDKNH